MFSLIMNMFSLEGKGFKDWTLERRYVDIKEVKGILRKVFEKQQPEGNQNSIVWSNQMNKMF